MGMSPPALAKPLPVAVLYPEVREPYRRVFLEITKGIEDHLKGPIKHYMLVKNHDMAALRAQLASAQVQVVIALGSRGLLAARHLQPAFKVIVGAVLMDPNSVDITGISLTPDPAELFRRLKKLAPQVKRVTVIYHRRQNDWLIDRARESAGDQKLAFNAFPVNDIHQAATLYRDVLGELKGDIDAVWLPQDKMIDKQAILPLVLQKAWDRDLIVFSSNLAHIKRGALFALYPDNGRMGRSLAELAMQCWSQGNCSSGVRLLRDLLGAINVRTAEHLGLKFTARQREAFDLVFPRR